LEKTDSKASITERYHAAELKITSGRMRLIFGYTHFRSIPSPVRTWTKEIGEDRECVKPFQNSGR